MLLLRPEGEASRETNATTRKKSIQQMATQLLKWNVEHSPAYSFVLKKKNQVKAMPFSPRSKPELIWIRKYFKNLFLFQKKKKILSHLVQTLRLMAVYNPLFFVLIRRVEFHLVFNLKAELNGRKTHKMSIVTIIIDLFSHSFSER